MRQSRRWWRPSWPPAARSSRTPIASSPSSSGLRYFSLCSSVPNSSSTSMLPVSGALQLHASGAMRLRPMISASGAYSRFVRPGATAGVRVEQVPQAALSRLRLELLDDRRLEVRVAGLTHLLVVDRLGRVDVRLHEVEQLGLQLLGRVRKCQTGSWEFLTEDVVIECRAATTPGSGAYRAASARSRWPSAGTCPARWRAEGSGSVPRRPRPARRGRSGRVRAPRPPR